MKNNENFSILEEIAYKLSDNKSIEELSSDIDKCKKKQRRTEIVSGLIAGSLFTYNCFFGDKYDFLPTESVAIISGILTGTYLSKVKSTETAKKFYNRRLNEN